MPAALILIVVFLFLGTCGALIGGIALIFPGTPLDALWKMKNSNAAQITSMAKFLGPFLIVIACVLLASAIGLIKRQRWAWSAALVLFVVNGIADATRIFQNEATDGLIGVVAAGFFITLLVIGRRSGYFEEEEPEESESDVDS